MKYSFFMKQWIGYEAKYKQILRRNGITCNNHILDYFRQDLGKSKEIQAFMTISVENRIVFGRKWNRRF